LYYAWRLLGGTISNFQPDRITIPILVLCTKQDCVVDYHQSIDFYHLLKTKKKLEILPLEKHNLKGADDVLLVANAIDSWTPIR